MATTSRGSSEARRAAKVEDGTRYGDEVSAHPGLLAQLGMLPASEVSGDGDAAADDRETVLREAIRQSAHGRMPILLVA